MTDYQLIPQVEEDDNVCITTRTTIGYLDMHCYHECISLQSSVEDNVMRVCVVTSTHEVVYCSIEVSNFQHLLNVVENRGYLRYISDNKVESVINWKHIVKISVIEQEV